jgi:hypothetical protein
MKIYPNKKPANYSFEREKPRYLCATFHNEIHPRENNLILIPSGQTNKIMFKFEEKINQYNSLCFHGKFLLITLHLGEISTRKSSDIRKSTKIHAT